MSMASPFVPTRLNILLLRLSMCNSSTKAVTAANVLLLKRNSGRISALANVDLSSMSQSTLTFSLSPSGCSFVTVLYWSRSYLSFCTAWYVSSKLFC